MSDLFPQVFVVVNTRTIQAKSHPCKPVVITYCLNLADMIECAAGTACPPWIGFRRQHNQNVL